MIAAVSVGGKIVITINDSYHAGFRLERRSNTDDTYWVYTANGFHIPSSGIVPVSVNGDILDHFDLETNKLYSCGGFNTPTLAS